MTTNDNCDHIWSLLSAYADGETTPAEAARVENHLDACPGCCRDLRLMRDAATVLAASEIAEPPPGLRDRILAATVEAHPARRLPRMAPAFRLASVGMAGSLAAFTLVALTSEPDDPRLAPVFRSALVAPPSTVSSGASFSALVAPDSGVQVEDTTSSGATEGRLVLAKAVEAKPEAAVPLPAAAPSAKPRFVAAARTRTRGWATPSLAEPSNLEPEETSPAEGPDRLASGTSDASELLAKDTAFETPSSATRDAAVAPFAPKPKLILVAAAGPSPSAVTSLADLRRELRHEAESQATYSDGETLRGRRQVAFDVIRSRF